MREENQTLLETQLAMIKMKYEKNPIIRTHPIVMLNQSKTVSFLLSKMSTSDPASIKLWSSQNQFSLQDKYMPI